MDQVKTGYFLKQCRNEKHITQEELANILGVSNRSVSRWENGINMPDFDILLELSKYYGVEVIEILEGEKKRQNLSTKTDDLILKVADYNNIEKTIFSKRMCIMFALAFIGLVTYAVIDLLGLSKTQPYETIVSIALGFISGTLLTGLLYSSRYILRLKSVKMRLAKKLKRLK